MIRFADEQEEKGLKRRKRNAKHPRLRRLVRAGVGAAVLVVGANIYKHRYDVLTAGVDAVERIKKPKHKEA